MTDDSNLAALLSSTSLVVVGVILGSFSKLFERVVIVRALEPSAYGDVSIALAILGFGATFGMVGLNQGIPRFVSRYEDPREIRGVWVSGLVVALAVSALLALVAGLNAGAVAAALFESPDAEGLTTLFLIAVPLVVGTRISVAAIRGLENTSYMIYSKNLLYPAVRIGLLVVLLGAGYGVTAAAYAYIVAAAVTFLVATLLLNRLVAIVGPVRTHVRELAAFSAPLVVSTVLSVLLTRTDTVMLGYFRPSSEVALYGAAYPLAGGMLAVVSAFGYLYLPLASRQDAEGDRDAVRDIYQVTAKWAFLLTFPIFLAFVAFPGDVLAAVFQPAYRAGAPALALLSVGFFTSAAMGRNRETVSAFGYTRWILYANTVAYALNLGLNLLLIPPYGITGAALASAVAFAALNAVIYYVLRREADISPFSRHAVRTYTVVPVVVALPCLLLSNVVSLSLVTLPAFLAITALATVAVAAVTGCLQHEDAVVVEFVEERAGIHLPLVRRYLPD